MTQDTSWKQRDAASYDEAARAYHEAMSRLAGPLATRLCELAECRPGDRVLDVGTGSGLGAREAARVVAPSGSVLGIDLSEGMVALSRDLGAAEGAAPLSYQVMDAEALQCEDASFDVVTSLCSVSHFPNLDAALREFQRVLVPGGRLVMSVGCVRPQHGLPLLAYGLGEVLRIAARPIKPFLKAPLDLLRMIDAHGLPHQEEEAVSDWSRANPYAGLLEGVKRTGYRDVRDSFRGNTVDFHSVDEYWDAQTAISTLMRKRLTAAPAEQVERLRAAYIDRAADVLTRGGRLMYRYGAYFVMGRKP